MQTQSGSRSRRRPWVLLLGPGERLAELPELLRARPGPAGERPDAIRALEDLGELFCELPDSGRLALDSDALPLELAGLVAVFLERRPGWELALCGSDPGAGAARRLLRSRRARWIPWPPDLAELSELVRPPLGAGDRPEPAPPPRAAPREGGRAPLDPELRSEIERVLGLAPEAPNGDEERDPTPDEFGGPPGPAPFEGVALGSPTDTVPAAPPAYFRDQVADLADIAQRLELACGLARERAAAAQEAGGDPAALERSLEEIDLETLRLVQFARTLSFLAAPPPQGRQRIELCALVEELCGSVGQEIGAPRYLFRADAPLWVQADKSLLAQALDALIYLAHHCAGPDGTVWVEGRLDGTPSAPAARVRLRFPAGPLEGTPPERALEPYALRRVLPALGPNSLAAARGILRGQGGELELRRRGRRELAFELRLPALEAAPKSQ